MPGMIGDDGELQGLEPPHHSSVTRPTLRNLGAKEIASVLVDDDEGPASDCQTECTRAPLFLPSL